MVGQARLHPGPVRASGLTTQVEHLLAARIRSGEFRAGDQLPTEHELAATLRVSRATVRNALGALTRRGLIVRRHGIGNFVSAASAVAHHLGDALDFSDLIARDGRTPGVEFDRAEIVAAGAATAAALGIAEHELVHRAAKRFTADGETVIYAVASLPLRLFDPELTATIEASPERTEPLFTFLADTIGVTTEYQVTSIRAVLGNDVAYPGSPLSARTAMLEMEEIGYSNHNEPIWHSMNWYPPGAMQFQLVRHRPHTDPWS